MHSRIPLGLALLLACGDPGGGGMTGPSGSVAGASDDSSGASATSSSSPTSSATAAASTDEPVTTTAETDGPASTTGTTEGGGSPFILYDGPPGGAVVPDWDAMNPRPLLVAQYGFGNAWTVANATIHPDGTLTSGAERIVLWGFEPLTLHYDGAHYGGEFPAWDPAAPPPVVALGTGPTYGEDWVTMTPGIWVDTNGGFIAPGSLIERVVLWNFDAALAPPTSLYFGPHDGTFVFPGWNPDAPSPMLVWGDTVVGEQWRQITFAVFDDGTTDPDPMINVSVFGW